MHTAGYVVETAERFYGDFGSAPELDESMVIFSRRWHCPKVYASEVVFQHICNYSSVFHPHSLVDHVHERTEVYHTLCMIVEN